jgi:hypothetical protein
MGVTAAPTSSRPARHETMQHRCIVSWTCVVRQNIINLLWRCSHRQLRINKLRKTLPAVGGNWTCIWGKVRTIEADRDYARRRSGRLLKKVRRLTRPTPATTSPARPESAKAASLPKGRVLSQKAAVQRLTSRFTFPGFWERCVMSQSLIDAVIWPKSSLRVNW